MTKTVIYLDVDGVLNAVSGRSLPTAENTGWEIWDRVGVNGYTITYSPELIDALHKIADRDDVEIRWLTTWREMARTHICPNLSLDGTRWEVVADGEPGHGYVEYSKMDRVANYTHGWWKFDAIMENIITTRPEKVIWIDDDLAIFENQATEILDSFENISEAVLIAPHTGKGLTSAHIDGILEFLDSPTED